MEYHDWGAIQDSTMNRYVQKVDIFQFGYQIPRHLTPLSMAKVVHEVTET
jgi:hypothetical protein